ncbi:DUF58 domain-containing protein [Ferrimonas senticii]|uniref:DUF58 domain-containing protein n=1 Tax=Ferrimonas senticii TaxID=394566 RepID=UPI0004135833|nr:DUF58 domain-containing protein [Ferrimonas senticii]
MKHWFAPVWQRWLANRLPAKRQQTLSHRSIFILPSGAGIAYLLMCLVLFLLGTNYQNNLILLLCFVLVSLFHTSVLMAFRNLAGLTIEAGTEQPCHQQQSAQFPLQLKSRRPRYQLTLRFAKQSPLEVAVDADKPRQCQITTIATHRGRFNPRRITIESRYPLGLCRVWSVQDLNLSTLVWPQPIDGHTVSGHSHHRQQQDPQQTQSGLDDFNGLERWQPGDSRGRIAWKQLAQTGQWQIKQFVEPQGNPSTLRLDPSQPLELGLSHLTAKLLQLEADNLPYALQLDEQISELGSGPLHLKRCLDQLALYRSDSEALR